MFYSLTPFQFSQVLISPCCQYLFIFQMVQRTTKTQWQKDLEFNVCISVLKFQ